MNLKLNKRDIYLCLRKPFLVMKITLCFILLSSAFAFSGNSYSQNTKLSLTLNDAKVSDVLFYIEQNSEFIFFYQDQQLDMNRRLNISVENKNVSEILDQLFKGSENVYKIRDRQIVIGKSQKKLQTIAIPLKRVLQEKQQAQKKHIQGIVYDSNGEVIPGTTIIIKGTTIGTITDSEGKFTIDVPLNDKILVLSFVGMKTQELLLGKKSVYKVVMEDELVGIGSVVVVGYGKQKRTDVTGAIASVGSENIQNMSSPTIDSRLQGQISGVSISSTSSEPGGNVNIRNRGSNSIS